MFQVIFSNTSILQENNEGEKKHFSYKFHLLFFGACVISGRDARIFQLHK